MRDQTRETFVNISHPIWDSQVERQAHFVQRGPAGIGNSDVEFAAGQNASAFRWVAIQTWNTDDLFEVRIALQYLPARAGHGITPPALRKARAQRRQ